MITEDYVSFETAKLLKEKGFNPINCGVYYSTTTGKRTTELLTSLVACPTIQTAIKWLMTEKNFNINVELSILGYSCSISHIIKDSMGYIIDIENPVPRKTHYYATYKAAADAAIKYCLKNLI